MINEYGTTQPEHAETPSNDDVISTINGLIQTCKDGQEGFQESAEAVQSSQIKSLFYELGQQRAQFTGELQGLVRELGGDPENSGSFSGAIHRGWINLKSAVTGQDDGAILNEAERGEDVAKNAYKNALETNLPANIAATIQTQYSAVQAAHDKVRDLRDAVNNAASSTATGS